jgi:hypothetical protein
VHIKYKYLLKAEILRLDSKHFSFTFFNPIPKILDTGRLIVTAVLLNKVISFTGKKVSVPEVWLVLFSHNQKPKI